MLNKKLKGKTQEAIIAISQNLILTFFSLRKYIKTHRIDDLCHKKANITKAKNQGFFFLNINR